GLEGHVFQGGDPKPLPIHAYFDPTPDPKARPGRRCRRGCRFSPCRSSAEPRRSQEADAMIIPPPPPTEGPLTPEELQLATRNRGMPLEAMRWDFTPTGLHYLLVHFDIPAIDPAAWRLSIGGHVERPLSLDLEAIRARPKVTVPVTLEC